jgi:hypothetical protein
MHLSLTASATLGGVTVANEDIFAWDGASGFSMVFDGSDVGVGGFSMNAFAILPGNRIAMSFTSAGSVPGIAGTVDESDIVLFTAATLGESTSGSFSLYFDGSDVGLTTSSENIDALEILPDGHLLISTTGGASVPGASAGDEDVLEFAPSSLGSATSGSWSLYFDGSDVGLSSSSEDIDALGVGGDSSLSLSTTGAFSVPGASGADEDVFGFAPSSLGSNTTGAYEPALRFNGSLFGLSSDVNGVD